MRHLLIYSSIAASALLAMPAIGADIKEREYGYSYGDTVKPMVSDAFMVCGDCKADKLAKAPRDFVAIKYNAPVEQIEDETATDESGADADTLVDLVSAPVPSPRIAPAPRGTTIRVGTVLFGFNSSKLTKNGKRILDKIAAETPPDGDLTVSGYACVVGTEKYNKKLSERRAKAVASYLKRKGAKIRGVEGKGECCQVSKANKKSNRRVEIKKKEK